MRSQYIIIFTIFTVLIATMLFLAQIEKNQREQNEDFWSIYFVYPLSEKNDFVIDNRSEDAVFTYELHSNDKIHKSDEIHIKSNERKLIKTSKDKNISPMTVTVTRQEEKKIIEKK